MTAAIRPAPLLLAIVAITGALAAQTAQSPLPPAPPPPIPTSLGTMPGISDLPPRTDLPPVLVRADGRTVTTPADWRARREEMKRILAYYATGLMPPAPRRVRGVVRRTERVLNGTVEYRLVRLSFGPGMREGFDIAVFTPLGLKRRLPVIVFPSFAPTPGGTPLPTMVRPPEQGKGVDAFTVPAGNQAARAAAPPTPPPAPPSSDPDSVAKAYADVFARGYVLVTYHYQDTGEDTIGRELDGSWSFRRTRYYPAYPGYDWGLAAGWAWGVSRCVDYLVTLDTVDATRIAATGHSRLGKAVLVAGAFDERIALVAPAGSGAGGTGAYRFNGARGGGREGLADMMRKYPNWFAPNLWPFRADVDRLPFDQHWLIALVAPRAFVSLEGADDQNCVVNALRQAIDGAAPAFALLGAADRVTVHYAPHRHAFAPDDWAALLDFADRALLGRTVARSFGNYPEAP